MNVGRINQLTTDGPLELPKSGLPVVNRAQHEKQKATEQRLAAVEEAARELITRLDEMEKPLNNLCVLAYVHGSEYSGPNWGDPLAKLRALVQERDALAEKVQK